MTNWLAGMKITAARLNSPPGGLVMATGSVSNSVTETTIGSFTIPGGAPSSGTLYTFTTFGSVDATGTPTLTLRFKLTGPAGTLLWSPPAQTCIAGTGEWFTLTGSLLVSTAGVSGVIQFGAILAAGYVTNAPVQPASGLTGVTDNTAASTVVALTAQWGTASASNTARTLGGVMSPQN